MHEVAVAFVHVVKKIEPPRVVAEQAELQVLGGAQFTEQAVQDAAKLKQAFFRRRAFGDLVQHLVGRAAETRFVKCVHGRASVH